MTRFDPNEHKPTGGGDRERKGALKVGGKYLGVFIKILERGTTQNGSPWIKFLARVVGDADDGPSGHEGEVFFPKVFVSPGAYKRLSSMCAAMGFNEPFNLQNDREVVRAMCFRPFKMKLQARQWTGDNGRPQVDMDLQFSEPSMSRDERDICDAWTAEQDADREARGGSNGYDDGPPPDDAPPPNDDDFGDIPF